MQKQWLRDVPVEVRLKIYKHYFDSCEICFHNADGDAICPSKKANTDCYTISLLNTCKTIREEVQATLFEHATFCLRRCGCWSAFFADKMPLIMTAPESILRIQNLAYFDGSDFLFRRYDLPKMIEAGFDFRSLHFFAKLECNQLGRM